MIYTCIVNYMSHEDTINCIESLRLTNEYKAGNLHLIVCDNDSPGESFDSLNRYFQTRFSGQYTFFKTKANKGFAHGVNQCIERALSNQDAQYIWVLNPDCLVQENSLTELHNSLAKNDASAGSSVLLNDSNPPTIQAAWGVYLPYLGATFDAMADQSPLALNQDHILGPNQYMVGASILIDINSVRCPLFFDESYFMYFEDVDFSFMLYHSQHKIVCSPRSQVVHRRGSCVNKSIQLDSKVKDRLYLKYIENTIYFSNKYHKRCTPFVRLFLLFRLIKSVARLDFSKAKILAVYLLARQSKMNNSSD